MNPLISSRKVQMNVAQDGSQSERHQLQELPPKGRHEPETRTCRPFAAGSSPVSKFLELAIKSYELESEEQGRKLQRVVHALSLIV